MKNSFTIEKEFNCPQCGDQLSLYFKHTKLIQCISCKSTIFLEDDATRLSGDSSVLSEELSLIELNQPFFYQQKSYMPIGLIRYSYGRGFWEEWWVKDIANNAYWLSVDEGDFILQKEVDTLLSIEEFDALYLNTPLHNGWIVTEKGTATCEGFSGSLPKVVKKGSQYEYVHLTGKDGELQTIEKVNQKLQTYQGKWLSPFDIGKIF